ERELIRRWVEEGATFSGHWAIEPPAASVGIPPVKMADWPRTPIDRFILAALEEKKLAPSPRADRLRLLRRLTLDLTGLPPTVEEIEEFRRAVEVDFEGAINATVDRLLASSA